jgi:excisionase family DNA binding protein
MPATMKKPAAVSPREVAEALDMSRRQVYRWIRGGDLPSNKVDGNHKITEGALAEKVGEELAAEVFRRAAESREDE